MTQTDFGTEMLNHHWDLGVQYQLDFPDLTVHTMSQRGQPLGHKTVSPCEVTSHIETALAPVPFFLGVQQSYLLLFICPIDLEMSFQASVSPLWRSQ